MIFDFGKNHYFTAEFGDYDENEHGDNYIATIKLLLKQTQQIEEKIMEVHQMEMKGLDPVAAENGFLRKAMALDTYGVDPHPVKVSLIKSYYNNYDEFSDFTY